MFLLRVYISIALGFSKVTMSFTITFRYHYIPLYVPVRLALYRKLYLLAKDAPPLCTKVTAAVLPHATLVESR